ncbi:MAG: APC family permease [Armatimonadetes bacterium]|nr:APC family permease [Armatimonadota bacterium]
MLAAIRRLLIGEPIPTKRAKHHRLPKILALPVFASDALSSTAYATEEILLALAVAGYFHYSVPIGVCIAVLLAIVSFSYRQTIMAYPGGGGAFIVVRENLGLYPGLIAASALLIDYVLTVAVSITAGIAALTSALPALQEHRVALCLLSIAVVTLANLRGAKESGTVFAVPTYLFIVSFFIMIVTGIFKMLFNADGIPDPAPVPVAAPPIALFILLRAFAAGCTALTGIEAIADGVPAFQPPETKNASITLVWMAGILIALFLGITLLAHAFGAVPDKHTHETVASQLAAAIFGRCWFYYVIQAATALILILAANTAYQDFPRLSSILARDGFAPRQLANLGDRLVFANGIVLLGLVAAALIVLFHGSTHALIPLYAVGVFMSFTLSQAGMVRRFIQCKEGAWRRNAAISGIGSATTGIVCCVITSVKFTDGAWMVIAAIPVFVVHLLAISRHYRVCQQELSLEGYRPQRRVHHKVIVLVPGVHRGIIQALLYTKSIAEDPEAVYVELDPANTPRILEAWGEWGQGLPLRVLKSPWRSLMEPLLGYIEMLDNQPDVDLVTVVIPEFVTNRWWHRLLHNSSGLLLKFALLWRRNVVVTNVRYYLDR